MKKLLLSLSLLITGFTFGQITLEKTFSDNEYVMVYKDESNVYYLSITAGSNLITIYNQDYSIYKTVNTQMPSNYIINFIETNTGPNYSVTKHLFNTDDKFEIFIFGYYYDSTTGIPSYQSKIINEDGIIIKEFSNDMQVNYILPYNDPIANKNKMLVYRYSYNGITNTTLQKTELYSLPTSILTTKEINQGGQLSAFPIPTSGILNIVNPRNGNNKIEITDISGKMVHSQTFGNEDKIILQVGKLPKGIYFYRIGSQNGKFIKE